MKLIYNKIFLKHKNQNHPECPERLLYFDRHLKESNIEAGDEFIKLVYDNDYISTIKKYSLDEKNLDADTYTNKFSYEVSRYAVGSAIKALKDNGFSLCRPPGHHATSKKAMGFCLFNNIAIATKYLINNGKKVFIIDFDGHHGNGTQEIFYNSNKALYLSTHQYPAYPGTGWVDEIGLGKGSGYNINIPMPAGTSDDLFLQELGKLIPEIKRKFNPDYVAVSAGFDAHYSDPLLQLNLSTNSFYNIGLLLGKKFKNIFACLEGGYNLDYIHKNIISFLNGVNNQKHEFDEKWTISNSIIKQEFKKRMEKLENNLKDTLVF